MKIGIDYVSVKSLIFNAKTYVMLREDGKLVIKGNTLRSRKYEPFIKTFVLKTIKLVLDDNYNGVVDLYKEITTNIQCSLMTVEDVRQKQTLNSSITEYQSKISAKQRNADAAYELAISDTTRKYEKGDAVEYYVAAPPMEIAIVRGKEVTRPAKLNKAGKVKFIEEFAWDIDILHYQKRLDTVTKMILLPIFGIELFKELFPDLKVTGSDIKKIEKLQEHDYEIE